MKRSHLQLAIAALFLLFGFSFYLFWLGEYVAVVAALFVIAVFLPVFFVATLVKSALLQILIGIACITQIISVPLFVISRDKYTTIGWNAVKDFSFTVYEFIPIYSSLAFFLVAVVCCVGLLIKIFGLPQLPSIQGGTYSAPKLTKKRNTNYYLFVLIAVLFALTPLNLWMFSNGISLTGVEPPRLPFRLSGILHYLTTFVTPLVLAVLYAKTSRAYTPAIILMAYAFLLGASHISKSALLLVMLPVFYCAISDRKYVLLGISAFFTLTALQIINLLRGVVYVVVAGKSGADTVGGLTMALDRLFEAGLEDFSIANTFAMLVGRIEGAQDMVLASKFNVDAIGGVVSAFQWFNFNPWNVFDADTYHLEWIGISLPEGFVAGGGGLLSKALLVTQSQPLYLALFALNIAAFILLGEWFARSISVKYAIPAYYYIIGWLYIVFFYIGSGSMVFFGVLTFLMLIVVTPKFSIKMLIGSRKAEGVSVRQASLNKSLI